MMVRRWWVEEVLHKGIGLGRREYEWRWDCSDELIPSVCSQRHSFSPASKESSIDYSIRIGIASVASLHPSPKSGCQTDILLLTTCSGSGGSLSRRAGQVMYCIGPHLIASNNLTVCQTRSLMLLYPTLPVALSRICSRPRPVSVTIPAPKSHGLATSAAGMNLSHHHPPSPFHQHLDSPLTTSRHTPLPDPYPAPSTPPIYHHQLDY